MILKRTFPDYYDTAFSREGVTWHRIGGNTGPAKREQFQILEEAGFKTPPHGLVGDVAGMWWGDEKRLVREVVAYEDEMAHCTEGKRVLTPMHYKWDGCITRLPELRRIQDLYCSAFVGSHPQVVYGGAVSWRHLQIGPHVFWIEYRSTESWMSNLGEGECFVVGVEKNAGFHPVIKRPLFAIDFVLGREAYAVDLNFGAGIKGSGVEKYLTSDEAVKAIEDFFEEFRFSSGDFSE
jgi:hypothetical protein